MNASNDRAIPSIEVQDAAAAMQNMEKFTRLILAVPKNKIESMLKKPKARKKKRSPIT